MTGSGSRRWSRGSFAGLLAAVVQDRRLGAIEQRLVHVEMKGRPGLSAGRPTLGVITR